MSDNLGHAILVSERVVKEDLEDSALIELAAFTLIGGNNIVDDGEGAVTDGSVDGIEEGL